jgi:hypothetical protein
MVKSIVAHWMRELPGIPGLVAVRVSALILPRASLAVSAGRIPQITWVASTRLLIAWQPPGDRSSIA